MSKSTPVIAIVGIIIIIVGMFAGSYNKLVKMQVKVESADAAIQTQLQRRADLIPNFVETVKGYSEYEKSTLQAVTEARSKVASASNAQELSESSEALDKAISVWVNAVTEAYPDIKADKQFIALTDELAGTENRVATARNDYNKAVEEYNTAIRKFPTNIIAGMFNFEKADFFSTSEENTTVPQVQF
jgi:LemA protein